MRKSLTLGAATLCLLVVDWFTLPFANKLTIHILAAVAEHEREAISARTKAALAAARYEA